MFIRSSWSLCENDHFLLKSSCILSHWVLPLYVLLFCFVFNGTVPSPSPLPPPPPPPPPSLSYRPPTSFSIQVFWGVGYWGGGGGSCLIWYHFSLGERMGYYSLTRNFYSFCGVFLISKLCIHIFSVLNFDLFYMHQ